MVFAQKPAPFRLAPFFRPRIWGFNDLRPWYDYTTNGEPIGEVWLTGDDCKVDTGSDAGLSLKQVVEKYGPALLGDLHPAPDFPLLVKVLFPKEKLSVQVHPDDALARAYGEPRGKTECWYALEAKPDAKVALGLKQGATPEAVKAAIENATLEDLMTWLPVAKNDMIFVDAGTVHAIAPGSVLLETQQNSDLTYRMYDYGRPRELHLDKSFAAMRVKTRAGKVPPVRDKDRTRLIDVEYFRIDRLTLQQREAGAVIDQGERGTVQILFAITGTGRISDPGGSFEAFTLPGGSVAVIPAGCESWQIEDLGGLDIVRIVARYPAPAAKG